MIIALIEQKIEKKLFGLDLYARFGRIKAAGE